MDIKFDISNIDTVKMIKTAYKLSRSQGLGFLHFQEGELDADKAAGLIKEDGTFSLDYVMGRACKISSHKDKDGKIYLYGKSWFDHSQEDYIELLSSVGINYANDAIPDIDIKER